MFFYNARFAFKLKSVTTPIPGSIVAASALSPVDVRDRRFKNHAHLAKRLFDPQLYMASIDASLDPDMVGKLAGYPWFHNHSVPKYDSGQYATRTQWKKQHAKELSKHWTRDVLSDPKDIRRAAYAAVEFQKKIGCWAVLLPGPLTTIADQSLQTEVEWIDAGLEACQRLEIKVPVFATIALAQAVLHVRPLNNPLIHSLSSAISSRQGLAGAYIVLEQSAPSLYFWNTKDALASLLMMIDDICRGANKRVVVNYVGTFGLVAAAAGAEIWSSGYYLTQRRFSLAAGDGRAHPRYHSLALAGDVGLRQDLEKLAKTKYVTEVMTPTTADANLRAAIRAGKPPSDVPEWQFVQGNIDAAKLHYLEIASGTAQKLQTMPPSEKVKWTFDWLENATRLAEVLKSQNIVTSTSTDVAHQRIWLDVFEDWRTYAQQ